MGSGIMSATCDGGVEIESRYGSRPDASLCARSTNLLICWGSACSARRKMSSRHSIGVSGCPVLWMVLFECPLSSAMLPMTSDCPVCSSCC